jgi:maltooligosyltrehalose trehalohydrolase
VSAANIPRLGAHLLPEGGVELALFAQAERCAVQVVDSELKVLAEYELAPLGNGYFRARLPELGEGALYFFMVDGRRLPDPHARYLPQGVHGPARVTRSFEPHEPLPGRPVEELVIYELHVGTFTPEGTFQSARERLPALVELGITCVELMPIAAFAGERGWGYDGVALFAPHASYGAPEDVRRFVERAHELGLSVLLDVVYNHFGPSGNYLSAYSPTYFSDHLHNAWGQAPNFEEPALRALVLDNARYWLQELGFDGLRLDATHAILDPSEQHVLAELATLAHGLTPRRHVFAEDERNAAELVTSVGLDGLWADDFHHQLKVTLTGDQAGYYANYRPSADDLARTIDEGWLYTGQKSPVSGEPRGTSAGALGAGAFVYCIQNHDQVGNRPFGDRPPSNEAFRASSLLLLFLPMTPLLFMGQEWAATTPFQYFTDHEPELGRLVSEGRRREFAGFPDFADPERQKQIPDPQDEATFQRSKLRWSERDLPEHARTLALYRDALGLRRSDPVLARSSRRNLRARAVEGALVVERSLDDQRRALVMNFSGAPLSLSGLAQRLELGQARQLLRSDGLGAGEDTLPPEGAVVLAVGSATGRAEGKP